MLCILILKPSPLQIPGLHAAPGNKRASADHHLPSTFTSRDVHKLLICYCNLKPCRVSVTMVQQQHAGQISKRDHLSHAWSLQAHDMRRAVLLHCHIHHVFGCLLWSGVCIQPETCQQTSTAPWIVGTAQVVPAKLSGTTPGSLLLTPGLSA